MKVRKRRLGQYRCWLCGKDLEITTPPYLRGDCCRCEKEGRPGGGWLNPPRDWTKEEVEKARQEYARTHRE